MNDGFPSNMPLAAGAILARIAGGTTFDINGGTIDGTVIGGTTPAAVSCTTLTATTSGKIGDGSNTPSLTSTLHVDKATTGSAVITLQNASYEIAFGCTTATFFGSRSATDLYLQRGGTNIATITSNGFDMLSGKSLYVNGTKVIGAQGAAVADASAVSGTATSGGYGFADATTFNTFVSGVNAIKDQLNAVLARLRAHGMIAT